MLTPTSTPLLSQRAEQGLHVGLMNLVQQEAVVTTGRNGLFVQVHMFWHMGSPRGRALTGQLQDETQVAAALRAQEEVNPEGAAAKTKGVLTARAEQDEISVLPLTGHHPSMIRVIRAILSLAPLWVRKVWRAPLGSC